MYINHINGNLHSGQWLLFKLSGDKVYNFHIKYLMLRSVLYKNVLIRSRTNKKNIIGLVMVNAIVRGQSYIAGKFISWAN